MIVYLVRHGQDDPGVRGGWSNSPLTEEGRRQADALAEDLLRQSAGMNIRRIFSSDLPRALQTARPAAAALGLPVEPLPQFREVNNGALAGMDNELALRLYPGLFWNTLGWSERYPDGESPEAFFQRIRLAWSALTGQLVPAGENVLLFTHSGVIHVIRHLILGQPYSNRDRQPPVPHAVPIPVEYDGGLWRLL